MSNPSLRRVIRRESHSPRSVAMVIAVVLLILVLVYAAVEVVLFLAAQAPLLVAPGPALEWFVALPGAQPMGLVLVGGALVAVIGVMLILLAVSPGRLSKQQMSWGERAVLVDNGVIAASLAQYVSEELGVARDRVVVGVGHRTVDVTVSVEADEPLENTEVRQLAQNRLDSYELTRPMRVRARVKRPVVREDDR